MFSHTININFIFIENLQIIFNIQIGISMRLVLLITIYSNLDRNKTVLITVKELITIRFYGFANTGACVRMCSHSSNRVLPFILTCFL